MSPVNVAVTVFGPSVAPETFAIEQLTAPVELTTPLHDCVPSRKVTVCPAGLGGAVLPSPSRSAGPPSSSRAERDVEPLPARITVGPVSDSVVSSRVTVNVRDASNAVPYTGSPANDALIA